MRLKSDMKVGMYKSEDEISNVANKNLHFVPVLY
jgi:hypothetical protein